MDPTSCSAMTSVLHQDFLLESIFYYLPLSSAPNVCRVSKAFRHAWNGERYKVALARIHPSEKSSSRLIEVILEGKEVEVTARMFDERDMNFLQNVTLVTRMALRNLGLNDKRELFAQIRPELYESSWRRMVSLFFPWEPHCVDLLEEPVILLEVLERANKRKQPVPRSSYLPGPYNDV